MAPSAVSLPDYVTMAHLHASARGWGALYRGHDVIAVLSDVMLLEEEARQAGALALQLACQGDYAAACRAAGLACSHEQFLGGPRIWLPFLDACELAARVDSFLSALETGPAGFLARGCRADLTTLLILADWCEENELPAGAAEARHLYVLLGLGE